jgi:hypothetical protein
MAISAAIIVIFAAGFSPSSFAMPSLPSIGSVIKAHDENIGAWSVFERGVWCTSDSDNCSYALLASGPAIIVAVTKPFLKDSRGGHLAETIKKTFLIAQSPGDERVECGRLAGRDIIVGLFNSRTKTLRAFYTNGDQLFSLTQKHKGPSPCEIGQD